ncbi:sll0787 family AIR synthase-like protein [Leptolyngbya sp. AN02str]|uniref:sll0787 family AIR synthase-like protein n=1 Tax=Leptolyngbya sp. AN02str TaxID=3423363 RepID=UPI003D30FDF5
MLLSLAAKLQQTLGILHKRDIQTAATMLLHDSTEAAIPVGDDCAAIPDGDGYLLLAAEGILPALVGAEPWFAGWCSVLVNVSDIYAMGGRPIAVVDALWSQSTDDSKPLWEGMKAASRVFNVPIVGGHTNCHSPYNALSVAILGRAQRLLTSFGAQPGDGLLLVANPRGRMHPHYPFWDAATQVDPAILRANLELLPQLAEAGLCDTAKDISMGGIVGTLMMLLETSGCGAVLDLDAVPCPVDVPLDAWLVAFPSYGFLLSVRPEQVQAVQAQFHNQDLICAPIGQICDRPTLVLKTATESMEFWDFTKADLTGFSAHRSPHLSSTHPPSTTS